MTVQSLASLTSLSKEVAVSLSINSNRTKRILKPRQSSNTSGETLGKQVSPKPGNLSCMSQGHFDCIVSLLMSGRWFVITFQMIFLTDTSMLGDIQRMTMHGY